MSSNRIVGKLFILLYFIIILLLEHCVHLFDSHCSNAAAPTSSSYSFIFDNSLLCGGEHMFACFDVTFYLSNFNLNAFVQ